MLKKKSGISHRKKFGCFSFPTLPNSFLKIVVAGWAAGLERLAILGRETLLAKETKPFTVAVMPVVPRESTSSTSDTATNDDVARTIHLASLRVAADVEKSSSSSSSNHTQAIQQRVLLGEPVNKVRQALAAASAASADVAILIGEDEVASKQAVVKDLRSGEQVKVPLETSFPQNKEEKIKSQADENGNESVWDQLLSTLEKMRTHK